MWEKYFCLFHNNENQNLMDLYLIHFYPSTYVSQMEIRKDSVFIISLGGNLRNAQYDQMGVTTNFSQAVTKEQNIPLADPMDQYSV